MSDRVFLDTNVVVYLFDADSPDRQARAREIFSSDGEAFDLVLSTQVLQEFYVTATRKLERPLADEDALEAVRSLSQMTVVQTDPPLILSAIELSQQHTVAFWDALVIEAAQAAGCSRLLSEDLQAGRRFGDLLVENPFEGSPAPGG
jgi:predicted nucleic acid-binding protein